MQLALLTTFGVAPVDSSLAPTLFRRPPSREHPSFTIGGLTVEREGLNSDLRRVFGSVPNQTLSDRRGCLGFVTALRFHLINTSALSSRQHLRTSATWFKKIVMVPYDGCVRAEACDGNVFRPIAIPLPSRRKAETSSTTHAQASELSSISTYCTTPTPNATTQVPQYGSLPNTTLD